MQSENIQTSNLRTTSNAIEISCSVIKKVAGNEVSDTVEGVPLNDILADTVAAKINSKLARFVGDK